MPGRDAEAAEDHDAMEVDTLPPAAPTTAMSKQDSGDSTFEELLRLFYQRLFPFKKYYKWLSYGSPTYFSAREFSFTIVGSDGSDVYLRYQSFEGHSQMRQEMLKLLPHKIDIGAVYSAKPREKNSVTRPFIPIEKELVFDIDMTDYDDIRTCCKEANVCHKCWAFMKIAVHIIDTVLRADFGFQHILFVYSGRRGIHCWICDERARSLTNEVRCAITDYLTLIKGGDKSVRRVDLLEDFMHPSISSSYEILQESFRERILRGQDILGCPASYNKILDLLPDDELKTMRKRLTAKWGDADGDSEERWKDLTAEVKAGIKKNPRNYALKNFKVNLIFQYAYPRLDVNVSKHMHHLLKSPFCIHPKTGRVCVPFSASKCEEFDPFVVPTVAQLVKELDAYQPMNEEDGKMADYKKTSLEPYIRFFGEFLKDLAKSIQIAKAVERDQAEKSLAF